jgi:prefoldin subunit 5
MREQLKLRLEELKKEFEIGQTRLQELVRQQTSLRETLLRISGAIQVLEEMLASEKSQPGEETLTGSPPARTEATADFH